ncbi:DUF4476 domain-containing protein [Ekhidna sp.]|uniref:DUF4476 domain-containing protein n=1 Tax=Ekhidna sp. TaxID=2608089 RepID=UPI003B50B1CD
MKNICLSIALSVITLFSFSQRAESFDEKSFGKMYKTMKKYKTDNGRLISSERYLLGSYVNSSQLRDLASTFDSDAKRGEFIKKYFHSITDYNYIASVFESFNSMSNALNVYEELRPQILKIRLGEESQSVAMDTSEFSEKLELVKEENYSRNKKERIRVLFGLHALSVTQIEMLINEFDYSRDRVWVAKLLYPRCTEKDKFYRLAKSFDYDRDKDAVLALMN